MNWKKISYTCFLLILPFVLKWYIDCRDLNETIIYSRDKKAIVTKTVDKLFGSEVSETKWVSGFWLGLFPGSDTVSYKSLIGVIPISGFLIVLGGFFQYLNYKSRKKLKNNKL
jgi:hypothetical protein